VNYVLEDQEGSIATLLNSTRSIAANESFTAYGNRRDASTWSGPPSATEEAIMDGITRQGFTGQTVLGQMGLNHMNGRVEDVVTGTFLSPDPRINEPYNTQDYNRYSYVYNNPLTNFDPTGFDSSGTMDTGSAGGDGTGYSAPDYTTTQLPDIIITPGCGGFDCPTQPGLGLADLTVTMSMRSAQLQAMLVQTLATPFSPDLASLSPQQANPCPGTGGDPLAFRQSGPNDPAKGYMPTHDLPPGTFIVTAPTVRISSLRRRRIS
jgi:RHS repeat-associated protein